jgi:hypothetical protein
MAERTAGRIFREASCAVWSLVLLAPLAGCGQEGPERVIVSGHITYGGGAWPKPGVIYFTPLGGPAGTTIHPGLGHFDTYGEYTAQTFATGDGLVPGKYRLHVECWEVEPSPDPKHGPPKSYVPGKLTLAELDVPQGAGSMTADFDVPKK